MDYKDAVLITVLFLIAFHTWTIPLQENKMPFGEGDSAWHFANADPQYQQDRSTVKMPYFIGIWYYGISKLGPFAPEYPPPNHLNYALMQITGGERIISPFIYIAITCFLGVFSTYFLIRKLYGTVPAFMAGFGLIYSMREIMLYLWGQRPTMASFVFIPLILYALYKHLNGFYADDGKSGCSYMAYLYIFTLLAAAQFLLHIQGSVVTFLCSAVFVIAMAIKHKRLPVSRQNIKHYIICAIVLLVAIGPFVPIYYGLELGEASGERAPISRLFKWTVEPGTYQGSYPEQYVNLSSHYSPLMIALVFVGIIAAALRRKDSDTLLLSWLAGIYLALHFDVFLGSTSPRIIRMMAAEPPMFFSLIAIGIMSIAGLIPRMVPLQNMRQAMKNVIKIVFAIAFVLLIIQTKMPETAETLKTAYQGISRITPAQYEAAEWLMKNVDEESYIYTKGTLTFPKARWMLVVANRHVNRWWGKMVNESILPPLKPGQEPRSQYFIIDYSDLAYLQSDAKYAEETKALQRFEEHNFGNQTTVYNKNNIKIYEIKGAVEEI